MCARSIDEARYTINYTVAEQPLKDALARVPMALALCEKDEWELIPMTTREHVKHIKGLLLFINEIRIDIDDAERRLRRESQKLICVPSDCRF